MAMPSWAWLAMTVAALAALVPLATAEGTAGYREQQAEGIRASILSNGARNMWQQQLKRYTGQGEFLSDHAPVCPLNTPAALRSFDPALR
jgi:hypothetical protein